MSKCISLSKGIKEVPITKDGNNLNLNIIEIGTSYAQKKGQTSRKKKYCDEIIKSQIGNLNKNIRIYKTVGLITNQNINFNGVNLCLNFKKLPSNIFYYILEEDIYKKLNFIDHIKNKDEQKKIKQIINKEKVNDLHNMLIDKNIDGQVRGRLTEIIFLNIINHAQNENIRLYQNGNIGLFNTNLLKKYNTEVDGIQTFYKKNDFKKMINYLSKIDGLEVFYNLKN